MENELFPEYRRIRENVKKDEYLMNELNKIRAAAERYRNENIKSLKLSDFLVFYKTGSRNEYEQEYFEHRKRMNAFAVLVAAGEEEYIKNLQDTVWAVTDEFTWALPAHIPVGTGIEECRRSIDLFAAETAFALSELLYMFRDKFEPILCSRIEYEVRSRVLNPYLNGYKNSWDERTNNWAAVCAGSVGAAFLYLADKNEINSVLPRIKQTLSCYLSGFGDDGACVEGINYWVYGFGYYTYFAQLLYSFSGGKEDLFESEKVKKIAEFPQKLRFRNNKTVSFSDSGTDFVQRSGLMHFLSYKFDGVTVPDDSSAAGFCSDHCARFAHLIRDFAWRGIGAVKKQESLGSYYFESAAWYIKKTEQYEFAAKAGNNGESHNHIDIGAFILNADGESIVTDPGSGEYTAAYFSTERYSCFAPSAAAHSIPVINDTEQSANDMASGKIVTAGNNRLVIELDNAYKVCGLKRITRSFDFRSDSIVMTDKFKFDGDSNYVTEHFVTEKKTEMCYDGLKIGKVLMRFDMSAAECHINEHEFNTGKGIKKVYLTDITIRDMRGENRLSFEFKI